MKRLFALVVTFAVIPACAHGANAASAQTSAAAVIANNPGSSSDGATVYVTNCSSCHGADGRGVEGFFPPLAHNPAVTGDPRDVIEIVDNGLRGRIVVNGVTYRGEMPAWKGKISASQLAAVITYIRSAWGNRASGITLSEVLK